jgi:hypothetical protein
VVTLPFKGLQLQNLAIIWSQGSIYWKILSPWGGEKISADVIWGKKYEKWNRKIGEKRKRKKGERKRKKGERTREKGK